MHGRGGELNDVETSTARGVSTCMFLPSRPLTATG